MAGWLYEETSDNGVEMSLSWDIRLHQKPVPDGQIGVTRLHNPTGEVQTVHFSWDLIQERPDLKYGDPLDPGKTAYIITRWSPERRDWELVEYVPGRA